MPERKRLHITPLNPHILPAVLPIPTLQQASNISFHIIQTFPEKNYGYVDLPVVEADKIRKKLHGSVLKGSKMSVEEARPKKASEEDDESRESGLITPETKRARGKRSKVKDGVIPGHELHNRKVRRGWTEPDSSKGHSSKRQKETSKKKPKAKSSSLTGEAECLFKTTLPPNKVPSDEFGAQKRKRGESRRQAIVHEFANTTKHAGFLRDDLNNESFKRASEYVEGKGWVDVEGNVLEVGPKARQAKFKQNNRIGPQREEHAKPLSRRSSRLDPPLVKVSAPTIRAAKSESAVLADETSSSGTSSNSGRNGNEGVSQALSSLSKRGKARHQSQEKRGLGPAMTEVEGFEVGSVERLSITRSSASPPPAQNLEVTSAHTTSEVHPLEALFKKPNNTASRTPKKPALAVSTSFNDLAPDADESESQGLLLPQTPFTQQDIRQRRQRSAAPTPDTAAPGKTFGDLWEGNSDISADDDDDDMQVEDVGEGNVGEAAGGSNEDPPESEFSKWFWEHRGETNRAWKRRRREATKEKRQKANRERRG